MTSYYDLPRVSNSSFSEIQRILDGKELPENIQEIFSFGRLADELIFEPEKADMSHKDLTVALKMRDRVLRNQMLDWYISMPNTLKQEIVLFEKYGVKCKMKADALNRELDLLLEFKTTAAATEKQFDDMVLHFNYDRQIAFYMDGAEVNRCLFVGVSKKRPHTVFIRAVNRSHPWYVSGKAKYEKALNLCIMLGIGTE